MCVYMYHFEYIAVNFLSGSFCFSPYLVPCSFSLFPFSFCCSLFFFNGSATTEIYTLSLHDALPISVPFAAVYVPALTFEPSALAIVPLLASSALGVNTRSEEHTSELQSRRDLVCRLLLEKKKLHVRVYVSF